MLRALHDEMRIGSAQPKGADTSNLARLRPCRCLRGNAQWQLFPIDIGAGRLKMEVGRNLAMLHRQHHFDQTSDARSRFEMTDIGLDRTHPQRLGRRIAKDGRQCPQFNRVAQRGAGAVR